MSTYKVINGDWMRDGYIDNPIGRPGKLTIVIIDGKAYDAALYDVPCGRTSWPEDARITLCTTDGELRAWGKSTSFSPEDGEIERVGGQGLFLAEAP